MEFTNNSKWGVISLVTEHQTLFMRRHNELSWVLEDKSSDKFTLTNSDFPPMVINVLENILLRGVGRDGVVAIEVDENFGTTPDNFGIARDNPISIAVMHRGEEIPVNDSNNELLLSLTDMVAGFPPSYYQIEVNNASTSRIYKQVFAEQSGTLQRRQPIIDHSDDNSNWTRVTFKPDMQIFNIIDDGLAVGQYLWKRCIDIAGTLKDIKVNRSGRDLELQTFDQYVDGWYPQFSLEKRLEALNRVHEKVVEQGQSWEVTIGRSHGQFEQISFVNGCPTPKGGTHVEVVETTLALYAEEVKKKFNLDFDMRDLCVFINLITTDKPIFSSQNDYLLTEFGTNYKLEFSMDFVDKFAKILTGLGPIALTRNVTNLIDATEAGGEQSEKCYLILTEGKSAKDFALAGYESLDTQFYGVLSIRGKLPNAKNDSGTFKNLGVADIIASLGLEKGVYYNSGKKLRYGHLMLMMDQDHDGSHIKGLIINLLHTFWPSLLKINFLSQFVTPVMKVKVKATDKLHEFYSIPEYSNWAKQQKESGITDWTARYYKGLASHDPEDAQVYMGEEGRVKTFSFNGPQDFNAITLAFSETRVHERKQWIMAFEEGTYLDLTPESITYSDFFNKEFILYSVEDNRRSIPSMVDGLKPSQRKALFTALRINLEKQTVDTFAGAVCKECEYHHGHQSMIDTVVGMAQKYVGTNNIYLFVPKGMFGSRREGTNSDAWYLSILLSPMTTCIFMKEDDSLLSRRVEDGKEVQPEWLLPIIPMALVNGCEGIGTGWSTKITKYDPIKIIENLVNILSGKEPKPLRPWFHGFEGKVDIVEGSEASYIVSGVTTVIEHGKVQITHLPPNIKLAKFKDDLDLLIKDRTITSYDERHREDNLKFEVALTEEQFKYAEKTGFNKIFNLSNSINTDNMHLIDEKGFITKYSSPNEILSSFVDFRLPFYNKRKKMLVKQLGEKMKKLQNTKRYTEELKEDVFTMKVSRKEQLCAKGYALPDDQSCNYLIQLPFAYLEDANTIDKIDTECKLITDALEKLEGRTASQLWLDDLEALKEKITLFYQGEIAEDPEFHRPAKRRRTGP